MTRRGPLLAVALLGGLACGRRSAPSPTFAPLRGDAARVGTVSVPASLALQVARVREVTAFDALDGLVQDALLAQAAQAGALADPSAFSWMTAVAVARVVPERLYDESRSRGVPADEEVATVRVVHAVVLRSPTLGRARAEAIAGAIGRAAASARSDEDFEARVVRLPHPGAQVTVQRLPEFDASGRTNGGEEFEPTFVAAALALRVPGDTSPVVETPFGWHVIRLIERVVPEGAQLEQRRKDLAGAVLEMRVRAQLAAVLTGRRRSTPVEVMAGADQLMATAASLP
jgi:hypothetical protein